MLFYTSVMICDCNGMNNDMYDEMYNMLMLCKVAEVLVKLVRELKMSVYFCGCFPEV